MPDFVMPSLGADMEAGTLVKWHVEVGSDVRRGDIIADVETEKGVIEVEVFTAGTVDEIVVQPGAKVPVGTVLARIRAPGEAATAGAPLHAGEAGEAARHEGQVPQVAEHVPAAPLPGAQPPATGPAREAPAPSDAPRRLRATPLARRMAAELGVDLTTIEGSGPGGAIEGADVEVAAAAVKKAPAKEPAVSRPAPRAEGPAEGVPMVPPVGTPPVAAAASAAVPATPGERLRQAIAAAMSRSNREIPHYFLQTSIDMQGTLAWLREENARRSVADRLLVAALLVKAVAKAVKTVPELNGFWSDGRLDVKPDVHVGLAVALRQGGLVAPALHDVGTKSVGEVMQAMNDLVTRARAGRLRSSEMSDATITVTNLGDLGVDSVFGVIYPPQVALVGFGRISERPWAVDGLLGVRPVLTASLAADHRATDGRQGARFLDAIANALANPETL